nr:MAG: internal scaffolding protein [Microviridae sp.]
MQIIARHQYDERPTYLASDIDCTGDKGVTKQSDLKDCDINIIMKKYERTGLLPDLILKDGRYGDFSDVPTYQESCEIVRAAQEQFDALGVDIRNRFNNDPVQFLAFASNDANYDEMARMGLIKPEVLKARQEAIDKANKERYDAEMASKPKAQLPT